MLRQVHPNALRTLQHQQANDLLAKCVSFHSDWDTLKWEFAPSSTSLDRPRFDAITGKDDFDFAVLRDKILILIQHTKITLECQSNENYKEQYEDLNGYLDWMIRKTKEFKVDLEGGGRNYRDGRPSYKLLGPSKEAEQVEDMDMDMDMEDTQCSGSSTTFELVSADHSPLENQPSTPPQEWQSPQ
jgi:hypothetical protein